MPAGALLIQLGGPGMLIGMGGGSASSMTTGTNTADLDFDSVQRGNAEIQRRAQEVIDRCWALGAGQPDPLDSRRRRGRPVERAARDRARLGPRRPHRPARGAERRAGHDAARGLVQRVAGALRAGHRARLARPVPRDLRARALPLRRRRRDDRRAAPRGARPAVRQQAGGHGPAGAARQAAADDAGRRAARARPPARSIRGAIDLADAVERVLRAPAVADKTFLITIGDRTVGGLCSRDQMVGPWQVPVADCATTLLGFDEYAGEAFAIGERTPLAVVDAPGVGADGRRRGADEPGGGACRRPVAGEAVGELDGGGRIARRGRRAVRHGPGRGPRPLPRARHQHPGRQGLDVDAHGVGRRAASAARSSSPLSLIVSAFAPCDDVRGTLTPQLRPDCGPTVLVLVDLAPRARAAGRLGPRAGLRPDRQRDAGRRRSGGHPRPLRGAAQSCGRRAACSPTTIGRTAACSSRSCEMAFAGRAGVDDRRRGGRCRERAGGQDAALVAGLFAEELGAVVQVREADAARGRRASSRGTA